MLIAGTAHYGKFPESVVKALELSESECLKDTYNQFINLNARNPFHHGLLEVLDYPVIHKEVINADMEDIKLRITSKINDILKS
jgi:hypothetical protein